MDVSFSQFSLNQLQQPIGVSNPKLPEDPESIASEFRELLARGQPSLPRQDPSLTEQEVLPQTIVEDVVMPTEVMAMETLPGTEGLSPSDHASLLTDHDNLPAIQNLYRWFATGIMSFDRDANAGSVMRSENHGQHMGKTQLVASTIGTERPYEESSVPAKKPFESSLQTALSNSAASRKNGMNGNIDSTKHAQHFSATDFLKKRCTVVENAEEIHIIVRDYQVDEHQQQLIGAELLQVFSQVSKAVRLTWNGKGYMMGQQKGESYAG